MIKKYLYSTCFSIILLLFGLSLTQSVVAQNSEKVVTGIVKESGSGQPLGQVTVSVSSTGKISVADDNGKFSISVPDLQSELIFNRPGYVLQKIYLNGRDEVNISLVALEYRSLDDIYNTPNGQFIVKDAVFSTSTLTAKELKYSKVSSTDQALQGKVAGMNVIQKSGMPGQRTYMNLRGLSSYYGNSEPMLIIDGMIHDHNYASHSLLEGYALDPFDVIDIDDISDISIQKDGLSFLGSAGSNGVININTEQKAETSTVMKFSLYGGIALAPENQNILEADDFRNYFSEMVGQNPNDNISNYPWFNGGAGTDEFYRYDNNTNWQEEIFKPASLSKFHFFLKGGDEIATYNLSTGYLTQKGIYDNSNYSRYNLRINGLINLTDKLSIIPNVKMSLADSKVANQGPSIWKNPITSALLKPSIMTPYARDNATGIMLDYLDDVDNSDPVFNVSNPKAIVENATGSNRNYHFLSSLNAQYKLGDHFNLYTLVGINFNSTRENIFLPDIGLIRVDSAYNSPADFVYEFRSTQNHTKITYTNKMASGHNFNVIGGFRYMQNTYKYNLSKDLNAPSDDFRSLGRGARYTYLRSNMGDNRGLKWIAYYGIFNYNFRNKYYINANVSYDGNSATNDDHRYNFYPSIGAAWRVSSESFMNGVNWIEDLKFRGSYSVAGNMYNTIYDYSKLYYTDRRLNALGTIVREAIPNSDMELEKRSTITGGVDLSLFNQQFNAHLDVFKSNVDNMVILQKLNPTFGYTDYYDNGGKLEMTGIEFSADLRLQFNEFVWKLGGSVANTATKVTSLDFINPDNKNIITSVEGAQYITSEGNALNAFYGYKTDGILTEAGIIGPNGKQMQRGDIKFVDISGPDGSSDGRINEYDKTIIGNPNPDIFGGFFTSFAYDRFELQALFNYSIGNDLFNYVRSKTEAMDSYNNQSTSIHDRWTAETPSTTMPRASFGDPTGNTVFSDRWIEDGSYLKLGQLTLSYALPAIPGIVKGVDIYLTATNLLTITNYSGYDPDFSYINSPFYMGIDYGYIPQIKSFIMGLKIDL